VDLSSAKKRRKPRIEIVPLIDIVFFLLATFVMVSLSMVKGTRDAIRVSLPAGESAATPGVKEEEPLVVFVTSGNEVFVGGRRVAASALKKEFASRAQTLKSAGLVVKADKSASVEALVKVLDTAKQAGIRKLGVAVDAKKTS